MAYEQKIELVKSSLISYCKDCIAENWGPFELWLSCEADTQFGHGYITYFKEHFGTYINSEIERILYLSGKNIVFAIHAFISYKKNFELQDIFDFTESFISEQLNDIDNWCDDIRQAMYEETSDYQREFGDKKEENYP